jgi:hypothetical protein
MTDLRLRPFHTTEWSKVVLPHENHDVISYDEGKRLAAELRASYVECSAKYDSQSVHYALETMLWRWYEFDRQKKRSRKGLDGCILQ